MRYKFYFSVLLLFSFTTIGCAHSAIEATPRALVLTTDFGVKDGAVSAMRGVAFVVSPTLAVSDLTHAVTPYNIWEAAYRLQQTYSFWPEGTVFVTVVDPGVGSTRQSLVVRNRLGQFFVGPDNGHLSLIMDESCPCEIRVLNEGLQRRKGSEQSYTFHGRDLYVYVGAKLASRQLSFSEAGPITDSRPVHLDYTLAQFVDNKIIGTIPVLDPNYGNVWTNIPKALIDKHFSGRKTLQIAIRDGERLILKKTVPLVDTFSAVSKGQPLAYFNSLMNLALALNQGDFAKTYKIQYGPRWSLTVN